MAICYDKLWKLLIDKKMNRTELKEASGISFNVLARLGKNCSNARRGRRTLEGQERYRTFYHN